MMVANPVVEGKPLPLCETASRLTAAEFQNFGITVDAFYQRPSNSPDVLDAARSAEAIVYEGHVEHQEMFPSRRSRGQRSGAAARSAPETDTSDSPAGDDVRSQPLVLDGLPLVVLQSCGSLRKDVFQQVFASGGVGMLGTSTSVHSISGSAFVKALCDGMLYRGDTVGEAFRDARNYFFCLQDLKQLRGHTQQGKSQRVALSFRLWGDPELELFGSRAGKPALAPVSARWADGDRLAVSVPGQLLPEVSSPGYFAKVSPGSETAGLVEAIENQSLRRVTPLYFFKLPMPAGFAARNYAGGIRFADD